MNDEHKIKLFHSLITIKCKYFCKKVSSTEAKETNSVSNSQQANGNEESKNTSNEQQQEKIIGGENICDCTATSFEGSDCREGLAIILFRCFEKYKKTKCNQ